MEAIITKPQLTSLNITNTVNIHFMLSMLLLTPGAISLRPYYNTKNKIKKFEMLVLRLNLLSRIYLLLQSLRLLSILFLILNITLGLTWASDPTINQKLRLKNSKDIYVNSQFTLLELPEYHDSFGIRSY